MAAHDQDKAARARDEILAEHPSASLEIVELDLGSLASVEAAADAIAANHDRIDILMCNAGVMATPQGTTEDGFDTQFGINVLGHWALVGRLLPIVEATPGARIVTVSSTAQHTGRAVDPDDPHMREKYSAWGMYGQTKLAMRHFAVGLQRRFDRLGVDAKALSAQPGFTNSDLQTTTHAMGGGGIGGALSEKWVKVFGMSIDRRSRSANCVRRPTPTLRAEGSTARCSSPTDRRFPSPWSGRAATARSMRCGRSPNARRASRSTSGPLPATGDRRRRCTESSGYRWRQLCQIN